MEVYRRGRHPDDKPGVEPAAEERFRLYHAQADGTLVEQTGLVFEDLFPGETFEHWPGRSFDFAESRLHALRSLEINPRWSDTNYLAKHKALQPAIFEPLVIGAVTALTTRTLGRVVANLGWTGIEMPRPVRPGETIYAESTIMDVRELAFASDAGYRAGRNACLRRRRRTGLPLSARLADLSPQRRTLRGCRLLKQQNLI